MTRPNIIIIELPQEQLEVEEAHYIAPVPLWSLILWFFVFLLLFVVVVVVVLLHQIHVLGEATRPAALPQTQEGLHLNVKGQILARATVTQSAMLLVTAAVTSAALAH